MIEIFFTFFILTKLNFMTNSSRLRNRQMWQKNIAKPRVKKIGIRCGQVKKIYFR